MTTVTLYKYIRDGGGTTVSPVEPENKEYSLTYRLIADEGKMLTQDNVFLTPCIDTDVVEGWYEVPAE